MKRKRWLLMLLVLVICLTACDTYGIFKHYPWDKADTWYCEEINYTITFLHDSDGKLIPSPSSPLIWNGETYNLFHGFHASYFSLAIVDESGMAREYLTGTWEYEGKNMVFSICEDLIFNGAFQELTFVPQSEKES